MARPARQAATGTTRKRYAPRMAPAQRREQLLDAALKVVLEQGYAGVSIEGIARTAGVTRPVIYDHFSNLEALIHALIEREEHYALSQLAEVVPGPESSHPTDLGTAAGRRAAVLLRRAPAPPGHVADHLAAARGDAADRA